MAAEKVTDYNATDPNPGQRLRGGTEGGEAARQISPNNKDGGTPDIVSPAGGVYPPPPSQAIPNTPAGRDLPGTKNEDLEGAEGKRPAR